jgi:signal transduction histidine kinase
MSEAAEGTGVGLIGMRERVHELGGRLDIRSGPDGTMISVCLPLQQNQVNREASRSTFSAA